MAEKLNLIGLVHDGDFGRSEIEASNPIEALERLIEQNSENTDSNRYELVFIRINYSDIKRIRPEEYHNIADQIQDYLSCQSFTHLLNFLPGLRIADLVMAIIVILSSIALPGFSKNSLNEIVRMKFVPAYQYVNLGYDRSEQSIF